MNAHYAVVEELNRRSPRTVEELALSLLARRSQRPSFVELSNTQLSCGGWSNAGNVAWPNAFTTGLVLHALAADPAAGRSSAGKAFNWLGNVRPREANWLYRWKFKRLQAQNRWDPDKLGWPWVQGTISWVAPTSMVILAHRTWQRSSPRVGNAEEMLLDRSCVNGGWNVGNSVVFGHNLDPHPDFTAMALLALRDCASNGAPQVTQAISYLGTRLNASSSPYSLAWAVMALSSYGDPRSSMLRDRLENVVSRKLETVPTAVLALTALALEETPYSFREGQR